MATLVIPLEVLRLAIQPDPDNRAQLIAQDPDQLGNLKINQLKSLRKM